MKNYQDLLGYKSTSFDGRDVNRLVSFLKKEDIHHIGLSLKEDTPYWNVTELNRENVLSQLKNDLAFAFDKALDQRGLSSAAMYGVIKMWLWVLDDELQNFDDNDYAQYGLPLFKAVALKFGFNNPIGDKEGNEPEFSADGSW